MKKAIIYLMIGVSILTLLFLIVLGINFYVISTTKNQIIKDDSYKNLENIDCILVLGAGVWGNRPSPMLEDRILKAIELYENGVAPKIIMSGDHGREEYDEVNIMKNYAIEKGIPSEDIFMDHAGFSTYDSIYRAKHIFEVKNIVIVTQEYHLFRALHIANKLGINALGVNSDPRKYSGQTYREIREILARNKDFVKATFKPKSTYLGDTIPVNGNGDITNDKTN